MQRIKNLISNADLPHLNAIALWFLIVPCSLLSHTWLPISPVLLFFFCSFVLTLLGNDTLLNQKSDITQFPPIIKFFLIFSAYIFFTQLFLSVNFNHYFGLSLALLYFVFASFLLNKNSEKDIEKVIYWFLILSAIVLCGEAILRYIYSFYTLHIGTNDRVGIYRFKYYGPIYSESNGTCIHILIILFFTFWWSEIVKKSFLGIKIILIVLVGLTLSRAGLLAMTAGLIYFFAFHNKSLKFKILVGLILMALFAGCLYFIIYPKIMNDDSFISKFYIIEQAKTYFKTADIKELLFGIGLANSSEEMGIYAHNYFLVFFVETGLIGLLFSAASFIIFIVETRGAALIVLLPFMVITSTTTNLFLPYFYVVMAIMIWQKKLTSGKSNLIG